MPFSNFYLIFKVIFYLIKSQKGELLTCRLTWRAAANVARETALGCDAALRPHGRAQAARARHRWRWRVARGHADGSTWVPVWGATWQAGRWRAHGYSWALVTWGDGTAMISKGAPLFNRKMSLYFLSVGLCSHTVLTFCRWRGRTESVGFSQNGGNQDTCQSRRMSAQWLGTRFVITNTSITEMC